jgi:NTP pyrophosphatase (non-canonical NTP hydrolase)
MAPEESSDEYVNIEKLKERVRHFVRERDWEKFHNPKDLAIAISVEAGELLELFQWMKGEELEDIRENETFMKNIERELADILNYCLVMANALELDLSRIVLDKIKENEIKYPKEKFRGTHRKYSERAI